jgi:UDP-3-O-[3-hydroxymyristoyl] glucosamine N-acyltransferase
MKLQELSEKLNAPFKGNGELEISRIGDLEHPSDLEPNKIYFVATKKYLNKFPKSKSVEIALTIDSLKDYFPNAILVPENESKFFLIKVLELFDKKSNFTGKISSKASVADSAQIGKNVTIMDYAVIMEEAKIGDNVVIYPHVCVERNGKVGNDTVLKSGVILGENCEIGIRGLIHPNTVIGADGFGFHDNNGIRYKVPQIGNVVIGDDVEMGACCTVDRATIETTLIGNQTKFDDHVHVGHNCRVGNFVFIAGGTVLAGSVIVEDNVIMGGQSAIAEHVRVRKGSIVLGLTGLTEDSEEKTIYFGIPARPALEMHRIHAALGSLPELVRYAKKSK